jgi:2-(1,2-epoxy-1,2-dihydrophenyl)acetyl-CoA isomerase
VDETKILREHKNSVKYLTINREKKKNPIDADCLVILKREVDEAGANPEVRAVMLAGAGANFSTGADLGGTNTGS